jgi:hypothetical protein
MDICEHDIKYIWNSCKILLLRSSAFVAVIHLTITMRFSIICGQDSSLWVILVGWSSCYCVFLLWMVQPLWNGCPCLYRTIVCFSSEWYNLFEMVVHVCTGQFKAPNSIPLGWVPLLWFSPQVSIDLEFEHRSSQTKDYQIGICCMSCKQSLFGSESG